MWAQGEEKFSKKLYSQLIFPNSIPTFQFHNRKYFHSIEIQLNLPPSHNLSLKLTDKHMKFTKTYRENKTELTNL